MTQTATGRTGRLGPRPLGLHLSIATATWMSSAAALPLLKRSSPGSEPEPVPWHPSLRPRAQSLRRELAAADPDALARAVDREMRARLDALERGIRAYRRHPWRRAASEPPAVWQEGTTRLLDYGTGQGGRTGTPLLVVPSLINRAYILDLLPERSFLRALDAAGLRPLLVDWGAPGVVERCFDLTGYIAGRLGAALDRACALAGRRPILVGYCMGGLLAAALAQIRRADVAGLVLLATPWDFHAERGALACALGRSIVPALPLFERMGEVPVDVLQALFAGLDPFLVVRKFCAFADLDPASPRAAEFVALEDWLNDGIPLAAPVARECLLGWYGDNTPGRGEWRVAGQAIRPETLDLPTLAVVPQQDRIVPPDSALALARAIPGAEIVSPTLGHIGMVSSSRAPKELWPQIVAWATARAARP